MAVYLFVFLNPLINFIFSKFTLQNIITIIVLLILAGVAIATLFGDNAIITKAITAKEKTQEAGVVERIQVEVAGSIWDMASNCHEWTTESSDRSDSPCMYRGDAYTKKPENGTTSLRNNDSVGNSYKGVSFRPILYL